MTTLMSADQFRKDLKANRKPSGGVFRVNTEPPVFVEGADRTLRFIFSDNSVDRMGDTIDAAGWDLSDFERNPVALWAHDSSAPPIGGASNVAVEGTRLAGDITFAPPETYLFADTIYRLVLGKFIRAVSVGFMPTKYSFADNDPARGHGGPMTVKRSQGLDELTRLMIAAAGECGALRRAGWSSAVQYVEPATIGGER